jgi:hypothetical protein
MKVKAGVTGATISFRNLVEISSGPVALCCFRPCNFRMLKGHITHHS